MLELLPAEIVSEIAITGSLSGADVVNLACTSHRLHDVLLGTPAAVRYAMGSMGMAWNVSRSHWNVVRIIAAEFPPPPPPDLLDACARLLHAIEAAVDHATEARVDKDVDVDVDVDVEVEVRALGACLRAFARHRIPPATSVRDSSFRRIILRLLRLLRLPRLLSSSSSPCNRNPYAHLAHLATSHVPWEVHSPIHPRLAADLACLALYAEKDDVAVLARFLDSIPTWDRHKTPLIRDAGLADAPSCLGFLLAAEGVDPTDHDALSAIAQSGRSLSCLSLLLEHPSVDVLAKSKVSNHSLLALAALSSNPAAFDLVLDAIYAIPGGLGASISDPCLLMGIVLQNDVAMLAHVFDQIPLEAFPEQDILAPAFVAACGKGFSSIVSLFLSLGLSPSVETRGGVTGRHNALSMAQTAILSLLDAQLP